LFDQILRIQLVLKGVCTPEEWDEYKNSISYDFIKDNNYIELKEAELMQGRLGLLGVIDPFVGKYYSKEWIQKNVLRLNDEEIKLLEKQMQQEKVVNFQEQDEDQTQQIQLQAKAMQLQAQLMPQPNQQIEAGQDNSGQQNSPQVKPNNPYNVK
jgi:hypothetical protein